MFKVISEIDSIENERYAMNLIWRGNQKHNEDISKATIRTIESPLKMSIHKYIGCGDSLFFSCYELHISNVDLQTDNFDEAEIKAMEMLQNRLNELVEKVNSIIAEYNN